MAEAQDLLPEEDDGATAGRAGATSRKRLRGGVALGVTVLALAGVWTQRVPIADHFITGQLQSLKLPARYRIVELTPTRAVLADVVVGDGAQPDFTAARVVIEAGLRWGVPKIGAVSVEHARLRATWQGNRFSMGSLDRLMEGPSNGPLRLPDIDLVLRDARASVTGDHGAVALALDGQGGLRDGFRGGLKLEAPRLALAGCTLGARMGGSLSVVDEAPVLDGPVDLAALACDNGLRVDRARIGLKARGAPTLDGGEADLAVDGGWLRYGGIAAGHVSGPVKLSLRQGAANAVWQVQAENLAGAGTVAAKLTLAGRLRAQTHAKGAGFARVDGEGTLGGAGVAPDKASFAAMERAGKSADGTLVAPLLGRIIANLRRESAGSSLDGHFTFHAGDGGFSAVLPELHLRGDSRAALLDVTKLSLVAPRQGGMKLAGSFTSATPGLPQIEGAIEQGGQALRLKMADYRMVGPTRAGDASLALPELLLTRAGESWNWRGTAQVSGALAQGVAVEGLSLPLDGGMDARGRVALWQRCMPVRFARLTAGAMVLDGAATQVCPQGGAVLATGAAPLHIAARVAPLELKGRLGDSPLALSSGGLTFASGGAGGQMEAKALAVTLERGADASQLKLAGLSARLGKIAEGGFSGLEGVLAPVPARIAQGNGHWRFADGVLALSDVGLTVSDREKVARFAPLVARGAGLTLAGGVVRADAVLREPLSDRQVVRLGITHDLASVKGHADLAVEGLVFDKALQPDRLSALVQGTIANAEGRFDGSGRIDWAGGKLASHATVKTDGFSFAGMVGPVKNVAGTVEFTDLLGLVTAPHQTLRIASINPGIEARDGVVRFSMEPGFMLVVDGAEWPFLDGQMVMLPTRMQLGGAAVRRFEMRVSGVNAAKFITEMNIGNLAATGLFDGRIPLMFDQNGGHVVGGELVSRPPGGSVAYVGALSYRDLTPMGNYAFRALRSMKFAEMRVGLDGDLAGEVVSRVSMRGLSQGAGASKNFLTRQIARIPLQFDVNIRAPFYQLLGSVMSLYDTSYVGDPREKGLSLPSMGTAPAPPLTAPKSSIQPSVSEHRP